MTDSLSHNQENLISGNYFNKYQTKNPIFRYLMDNFLKSFDRLFLKNSYKNLLEVGCGEGYLLSHIKDICKNPISLTGIDNSNEIISFAKQQVPQAKLHVASASSLPFNNQEFDIVVTCEVLEHVPEYEQALAEISRVGSRYFIFSVPQEPIWRVLNVLRFKYLADGGNTPGHVNHWSREGFLKLISQHFNVEEVLTPFPWTMILAKKTA